ncbi:MAG TPA: lipoyl(octanoyl) transferase LipB, partial [Thermodesulfobacteriota bacterium]|nr:lipoyl(octanoyl) transferase LipB [Thermodesulfobacteriota bacterium]
MVAIDLGRIGYEEALALQRRLARARQAGAVPDLLLLCEHPPVVTLGRGGRPEHLLVPPAELVRRGIACVAVERGGDVTYHGPGQLVGYPILELTPYGRDLHRYLRRLEEALVLAAARVGVAAARLPGRTGVWVAPADGRGGASRA